MNRSNDATTEMLNRLAFCIDRNGSRSRHPFIERSQGGPQQKNDDGKKQYAQTELLDTILGGNHLPVALSLIIQRTIF